MGVPYSWFLTKTFEREQVLHFVVTIPNEGLTERFADEWVDVYRGKDGLAKVDSADVAAFAKELAAAANGVLPYGVAAALELGKCIAVEVPRNAKRPLGRATTFAGYRCVDLGKTLAAAEGLLDDGFDDGHDGVVLGELCASLKRALELHVAVVFGE